MHKPLHHKASWLFCRDTEAEVPPVAYFDEVQVLVVGDEHASGTYRNNGTLFCLF